MPILGSLPIIGSLFRSSGFRKGETELLIVVTPRLVAPIKPGQVRLPTDAVTEPTAAEAVLLGTGGQRVPLPAPTGPVAVPATPPVAGPPTSTTDKPAKGRYEY